MKTITIAVLVVATLAPGFAERAANAQGRNVDARGVEARRVWVYIPRGSCGPPDYTIVPRYCYDPRDDRVDTSPYAKPVAPVGELEYGGPSGW
jgi:hypothetical protein